MLPLLPNFSDIHSNITLTGEKKTSAIMIVREFTYSEELTNCDRLFQLIILQEGMNIAD